MSTRAPSDSPEKGRCTVSRPQPEKRPRISRQPTAPQPVLELPLVAPTRDDGDFERRQPRPPSTEERGVSVIDFYI